MTGPTDADPADAAVVPNTKAPTLIAICFIKAPAKSRPPGKSEDKQNYHFLGEDTIY